MTAIVWLSDREPFDAFPPLDNALKDPDGLLAAGGDLSPQRLIAAYRRGIFPWYSEGQPILWWSPDPRAVLRPADVKLSKSLRKTMRHPEWRITMDTQFAGVIASCADRALRPEGTWIVREMRTAYEQLHALGLAHSVEVWRDGMLVGGLYGVALGRVFYGESMFSRVTDASKIALVYLCEKLLRDEFAIIDCQMATPHLLSMGAHLIPRAQFASILGQHAIRPDLPGPWKAPLDLQGLEIVRTSSSTLPIDPRL